MDWRTLFRLDTPVLFLISETPRLAQGAGLMHSGRGTWAPAPRGRGKLENLHTAPLTTPLPGSRNPPRPPPCPRPRAPARLSSPPTAHWPPRRPAGDGSRRRARSRSAAGPNRAGGPAASKPPGSSLLGSPSFCPSPRQGVRSPQVSGVSPPSKGGRGRKAGFGFVFCVFFSVHVPQWPRHDGDVPPSSPGGEMAPSVSFSCYGLDGVLFADDPVDLIYRRKT